MALINKEIINNNKLTILSSILIVIMSIIVSGYLIKEKSEKELVLHGNVDIRQVDLGFRVYGRILNMYFEEGDRVKPGSVLASLDKAPYENEYNLAKAQVTGAQANLTKLQKGNREEDIEQARYLVQQRQAAFENANKILDRQSELLKKHTTSEQAYEDAIDKKDEADALLKAAQESFELMQKGAREEDIDAAKADLDAAKARLSSAEVNLKDAEIISPTDGIILTRVREPGTVISQGAPVYVVLCDIPIIVRSYISEKYLGRVKPGMEVLIYTDTSTKEPIKGQIGFISSDAEFTPKNIETKELRVNLVYRLRIIANDSAGNLRNGMPVTVIIKFPD